MKSLKQYIDVKYIENHTNESILDDEDVLLDPERDKEIIESWIGDNYKIGGRLKINDDLTVDCSGDVMVKNKNITSLTNGLFRWGKVDGCFGCSGCKNLTSLECSPKEVGSSFYCSRCENLKSLESAPEKVSGDFSCYDCDNLRSLEGAPKYVGAIFTCILCENLTSLKGAPKEVGRVFNCSYCDNLRSLKGAPEKVGGDFYCSDCKKLIVTDEDRKKYNIMN